MRAFITSACIALVSIAVPALAQAPEQPRPNTYRTRRPTSPPRQRIVSPDVHPDKRITFRISAPKASEVALSFGAWSPKGHPMSKGSDGVWSVTIGPVKPEIHYYNFSVDGLRVVDPSNPHLKLLTRGPDQSVVEVPGTPPRFDEVQNVPHGAIHIRSYTSTPLKRLRPLYVYVPPNYDTDASRKYPVLYLRHGSGDSEATWSRQGRAGVILENLIAQGKAVPMLIVMTNGDTDGTWAGGSSPEAMEALAEELLVDVIPLIEKSYRALPGRENRAITGLSMGGGQAFTIGLKNLDTFASVGEFSSGLLSDPEFDLGKHVPGFWDDPEAANKRLKYLFLGCGTEDNRYTGQRTLVEALKEHGIRHEFFSTPGGHEWMVWRHLLAEILPKLFQP